MREFSELGRSEETLQSLAVEAAQGSSSPKECSRVLCGGGQGHQARRRPGWPKQPAPLTLTKSPMKIESQEQIVDVTLLLASPGLDVQTFFSSSSFPCISAHTLFRLLHNSDQSWQVQLRIRRRPAVSPPWSVSSLRMTL